MGCALAFAALRVPLHCCRSISLRCNSFACRSFTLSLPPIDDQWGSLGGAGDGVGLHKVDPGGDADALGEFLVQGVDEQALVHHAVEEHAFPDLYSDLQDIIVPFPGDDQLVGGCFALEGGQNLPDPLGKDVHALDDDDFVGAAEDAADTGEGPAAGTGLIRQGTAVAGAEADEGYGFLGQGGNDQSVDLARREI